MNTDKPTCGTCRHFAKLGPEPRGHCHFGPPTVFAGGDSRRPMITVNELGCGHHDASAPSQQLGKTNADTPGHAAKLAREMKRK